MKVMNVIIMILITIIIITTNTINVITKVSITVIVLMMIKIITSVTLSIIILGAGPAECREWQEAGSSFSVIILRWWCSASSSTIESRERGPGMESKNYITKF